VPPEGYGDNVVTLDQVDSFSAYVRANGGSGMMLWSLQSQGTPSATQITQHACAAMGMAGCAAPLPF
jgi:hypothetical protein